MHALDHCDRFFIKSDLHSLIWYEFEGQAVSLKFKSDQLARDVSVALVDENYIYKLEI